MVNLAGAYATDMMRFVVVVCILVAAFWLINLGWFITPFLLVAVAMAIVLDLI